MAAVVITGWGLLAQALARAACDRGVDYRVVASSVPETPRRMWRRSLVCDILPGEVLWGASHLFHTAALTSVQECERLPELAQQWNVEVTAAIVERATEAGVSVVYPSTDWVFDGAVGSYSEDAAPNPVNVYGATKLAGERCVLEGNGLVVRGAFVGARPDNRQGLREKLARDPTPAVARERIFNPLWVGQYANFLLDFTSLGVANVVHLGSSSPVRWSTFCRTARRALLDRDDLAPAPKDCVVRPVNTSLATSLAVRLLQERMPTTIEVSRAFASAGAYRPRECS